MSNKLLDPFKDFNVEKIDSSVQKLMECEHQYGKLLREYRDEIDFIKKKLEELRQEEIEFYETKIPKIEKILVEDDVNDSARELWMADLQNSMNLSFQMSRNLLNDFAIRDLNEFRKRAEELIKGV